MSTLVRRGILQAILGFTALSALVGCTPAWEAYYAEFDAMVEALPDLSVRIVNENSQSVQVYLESGISAPQSTLYSLSGLTYPDYLEVADEKWVQVAAGGTAEETLKCGEAIGLSALTPTDQDTLDSYDYNYDEAFRLWVYTGNVSFSGLGGSAEDFTGDVVGGARFIRPETDGMDCATQTLVITILNTTPPTGVVSVE